MKELAIFLVQIVKDKLWLNEERLSILKHKKATVGEVVLLWQFRAVMWESFLVEGLPSVRR